MVFASSTMLRSPEFRATVAELLTLYMSVTQKLGFHTFCKRNYGLAE